MRKIGIYHLISIITLIFTSGCYNSTKIRNHSPINDNHNTVSLCLENGACKQIEITKSDISRLNDKLNNSQSPNWFQKLFAEHSDNQSRFVLAINSGSQTQEQSIAFSMINKETGFNPSNFIEEITDDSPTKKKLVNLFTSLFSNCRVKFKTANYHSDIANITYTIENIDKDIYIKPNKLLSREWDIEKPAKKLSSPSIDYSVPTNEQIKEAINAQCIIGTSLTILTLFDPQLLPSKIAEGNLLKPIIKSAQKKNFFTVLNNVIQNSWFKIKKFFGLITKQEELSYNAKLQLNKLQIYVAAKAAQTNNNEILIKSIDTASDLIDLLPEYLEHPPIIDDSEIEELLLGNSAYLWLSQIHTIPAGNYEISAKAKKGFFENNEFNFKHQIKPNEAIIFSGKTDL